MNNEHENIRKIDKMTCPYCGKRMDVTELDPLEEFNCILCNKRLRKEVDFENYSLMSLCGIGGMSKVYKAIDKLTREVVALKITDPEFSEEIIQLERFKTEADLVAQIDHPGIVKVFRGGVYDNKAFLVMEFMKKGNLESLQTSFSLPPCEKILHWLSIIASGLYEAYKIGIVHHDVKPANIMLSEDGEVKIGDFDLAEMSTDSQNGDASEFASIPYVSPERLIDGHEGAAGDIFSLGVSAYELLTNEYPFGNSGEIDELLRLRQESNYQMVHILNSTVTKTISEFISSMMAYNPEDRPSYPEIIDMFGGKSRSQPIGFAQTVTGKLTKWLKHKK